MTCVQHGNHHGAAEADHQPSVVTSAGVLINCSCQRCHAYTFFYFYVLETSGRDDAPTRLCGHCALDTPIAARPSSDSQLTWATRFECKNIKQLWDQQPPKLAL